MIRVSRARYAGACYGVKRALRLVEEALLRHAGPVHTLGPLIHNPQVVQELAGRGVSMAESVDDVDSGTLVIRSHGVSPQVIAAALAKGLEVLDATCPHVSQAQAAASGFAAAGYVVVVVGERGHPEVEGISAYAGDQVIVVQSPDELPQLPAGSKIGVVAQTTQTSEALESITNALVASGIQPEVHDTICFATRQRQEAATELACQVDLMLVVGGRNSSNTTRLAELCAAVCAKTFLVENPAELDPAWFADVRTVGITAGASTPEQQIVVVEERLQEITAASL